MDLEISGPRLRWAGRDLGRLEPYFGRWVWPLREMQVGDTFTVATADKPVGAVRNYVASQQDRLGMKFVVNLEGDVSRVTCVPNETTLAERLAWRNIPLFKDAPDLDDPDDKRDVNYLGILQPPASADQNWRWPFSSMEPGQWFLVDKQHKEPELIRRSAYALARSHGLAVTVNIDPPEHPGFVRIEARVPRPTGMERPIVSYKTAREIVARCYGVNLDQLDWSQLEENQECYWTYDYTVPPAYPYLVFRVGDHLDQTFGIHISNRGLKIARLPEGWTLFQWLEQLRKDDDGEADLEVDPLS